LAGVIDAWDRLSERIRAGIVPMVKIVREPWPVSVVAFGPTEVAPKLLG
jgi:hypothetical protein